MYRFEILGKRGRPSGGEKRTVHTPPLETRQKSKRPRRHIADTLSSYE